MTSIDIKSTILLDDDEIKKYIILNLSCPTKFSYEIFGDDNTYIENKGIQTNNFSTCFECNDIVTYLIKINSENYKGFKFFKYNNNIENKIYNYFKKNIVMNIRKKNSLPNQHILNQMITLHNMKENNMGFNNVGNHNDDDENDRIHDENDGIYDGENDGIHNDENDGIHNDENEGIHDDENEGIHEDENDRINENDVMVNFLNMK